MNIRHAKTFLLGAIALCFLVSLFENKINSYWLFISYDIGINVILAVSLNLINGYTGQFSLGHAGFMAVGAYSAAAITLFVGPHLLPPPGSGLYPVATAGFFFCALIAGGLAAALAGWLVGMPSLRLKGDYLAIVTLGFGEIIRVIFRNIDSLGGALGLNGIPAYANIFWVFGVA